ncbi:ERAL1 GTPase, partial [Amia calva]|nr:ERAL1 GTPase [Amia calva]
RVPARSCATETGSPIGAREKEDSFCLPVPSVSPNKAEQQTLLVNCPDQPVNPKVLKVAIVGAPNAGKSTLSNQLLGRKVFAVSKKVHTTRSRAQGVITEEDTQLILLDTPGLTTLSKVKRHHLEKSLLVDPSNTLQEADIVLVLVDVSDHWTRDRLALELLKCLGLNPHIPAVLVLNKVDLLKNKTLLLNLTSELTEGTVNGRKLDIRTVVKTPRGRNYTPRRELDTGTWGEPTAKRGWPHFRDVFMLSALDGDEVETLKRYLVSVAKPGPWLYHSEVLTDQNPEEICINMVRGKLLEHLPQEVPYNISQNIEIWEEGKNGELHIHLALYVKKESHMKMLIGLGGQTISRIAREAGGDLMDVFLCDVNVKLSVKLKK